MVILVLCPHTDDGELGCGGTLAKCIEKGEEVHYAALSVPAPKHQLLDELTKATKIIGIPPKNVHTLKYTFRRFHAKRQDILDTLIKLRNRYCPDTVYCPATTDTHQDHEVVCNEATRAFRDHTLLGYELPRNNAYFHTHRFEVLIAEHVRKKMDALLTYKSQYDRPHWNVEHWRSTMKLRGTQIGVEWAEAFEVIKEVIR